MSDAPTPRPYAEAAKLYWDAGWRGLIPVVGKFPPEPGMTGWHAPDPSFPDVQAHIDFHGDRNIALRMPANVVGIDVDAYPGKNGAASLAARVESWGPLPPTWRSTSRDDGVSGIYLFRIPPGLAWPGQVGQSIETITISHRYSLVWPSIHPSGRVYRWIGPDGLVSLTVPSPDDLPHLPPTWVLGLIRGQANPDDKNDVDPGSAAEWINTTNAPSANPCGPLVVERNKVLTELTGGGSRHDTARDGVLAMVRIADQGHVGIAVALDQTRHQFINLVSEDRSGAASEWSRILLGAISIVTANPSERHRDPCLPPIAGITQLLPSVIAATMGATAQVLSVDPDMSAGAPPVDLSAPLGPPAPVGSPIVWTGTGDIHEQADNSTDNPPTELRRTDGTALFYPSRVNGILGPSESGKTWIAIEAVRQALVAGRRAAYYDFEDTASGIRQRLRAMGVTDEQMGPEHFHYFTPDVAPGPGELEQMVSDLVEFAPSLIVLDGVNAAMTIMGLDLNDNKDATKFAQVVLKPLCECGAAVVYIDHVPKNNILDTKGGIGAQAKRAMTTGTALRVDVIDQFSRGHAGSLAIVVDKDRNGFVRQRSRDGEKAGTAYITPYDDGDRVAVQILYDPEWATEMPTDDRIKIDICAFIDQHAGAEGASRAAVTRAVTGKASDIRTALAWLIQNGHVSDKPDNRGSHLFPGLAFRPRPTSSRSWDEVDCQDKTSSLDLVPTSSPLVPASSLGTRSHSAGVGTPSDAPPYEVGGAAGGPPDDPENDLEIQTMINFEGGGPDDDPGQE